jgi:hypothetical protein
MDALTTPAGCSRDTIAHKLLGLDKGCRVMYNKLYGTG